MQTTTYTVTAANEGGTSTASVTITVTDPLPIVELTVEPAQIMTGESATLIWNTTYADTLSIDQDLGTVEPNGTMTVYPLQTTTYTITATGSGGTATASATATVTHPITLRITEPLDGAGISDTSVTVRGTIAHTKGIETGLRVNGMPVVIEGDQFTANHVPLAQGENTHHGHGHGCFRPHALGFDHGRCEHAGELYSPKRQSGLGDIAL